MADEEQESTRGFRVQDRRRFSPETGELREEAEQKPTEETRQKTHTSENEANTAQYQGLHDHSHESISFSSFLLGLITQALMFMGEVPSSPEQPRQVDLGAARQMIDLLSMIEQKTKGNLEPAEETMLTDALFDLRMRYVQIAKK